MVRKKQLWTGWEIDWKMPLDSIVAIPTIENEALTFAITEVGDIFVTYASGPRTIVRQQSPIK